MEDVGTNWHKQQQLMFQTQHDENIESSARKTKSIMKRMKPKAENDVHISWLTGLGNDRRKVYRNRKKKP